MTAETERELRQAGADDLLLAALREAAAKPAALAARPPAPSTLELESVPGDVQVYVDDEFKGTTSKDGRLRVPLLAAGAHHLRFSLEGYQERDDQVDLVAGEDKRYSVNLEALKRVTLPQGVAAAGSVPPQREGQSQTFKLWHLSEFHLHDGDLSTSPGRVKWEEIEPHANPNDDFEVSCPGIIQTGRYSKEIKLRKPKKGEEEKLPHIRGALQIRLRDKNYVFVAESNADSVLEAIANACPR